MTKPATSILMTVATYELAVEQLARFADDPSKPRETQDDDLLNRLISATDNAKEVTQKDLQAGLVMAEMVRPANSRVRALHDAATNLGVDLVPVHG